MANPLDYNVNRYTQGVNGFGRKPPNVIYTCTLAASTNENVTVPSASATGAMNSSATPVYLAIFSYQPTVKFYVAVNSSPATVPAGGTFASANSELLPPAYIVRAGDVISVISGAGGDVSVTFYAIPEA